MNFPYTIPLSEAIPHISIRDGELILIEPSMPSQLHLQPSDHSNNDTIEPNDVSTDWIKENKELGDAGEKYVENLLITKYGINNVNKESDHAGYDFKVQALNQILRIEVKTITQKTSPIHITINELKKANKYQYEYYIYIVVFKDESRKKADVFYINNPINNLDVCMDYIDKEYRNDCCSITGSQFIVKIDPSFLNAIKSL